MANFIERTANLLGFTAPDNQEHRAMAPGVLPPARSLITHVSPDTAMGLSAVSRCVSIISNSVTQMDLQAFSGSKQVAPPALLRQPNVNDSQQRFIEETVVSLATHGNAYWRLVPNGDSVANLEVLDPDLVTIQRPKQDNRYFTGAPEYYVGGVRVPVKHLKLMSRPGLDKGLGPIQMGQSELIGLVRLRAFSDQWFTQGVPTGVLRTEQHLNPTQSAELAQAWEAFVQENSIMIAHSGLQYEHLHLKPAEAQFQQMQHWYTNLIGTLFGVPYTMLGVGIDGTSMTYTNAQEQQLSFMQTTLIKYMNEIEQAFTDLMPSGIHARFDESDFLRMSTAALTETVAKQHETGLITANEARAQLGYEPRSDGDQIKTESIKQEVTNI